MNEDIPRIQRVSRLMRTVCTSTIVAIPLVLAATWTNFEALAPIFQSLGGIPYQPANLTWVNLLSGFVVSLLLAGVVLYGLHRLRRLFDLYARGHVFTSENAGCLRGFALSVILYAALSPPVGALLSVILTIGNPPGQRMLMVTLTSTELALIFLGAVLLVISWVMNESARLADDNAKII